MKTIMMAVMIGMGLMQSAFARDSHVRGYTRRDGTYVESYHRTTPDYTTSNNYGTYGNVNPYTGSMGTKPRQEIMPSTNYLNSVSHHNNMNGFGGNKDEESDD